MKLTLRGTLKRTALILAIVLTGLAVMEAVPAAHAATTLITPTITTSGYYFPNASGNDGFVLNVQGVNFTPGGSVKVEVLDSSLHLVSSRTFNASTQLNCHLVNGRLSCTLTGTFYQGFEFYQIPPTPKTYWVIAYDYGTGLWSNWSSQYIV